jgi:hypothetical protein
METNDKNLGDKKWNNEQEVNEGFSAQNLPNDYNNENPLMTSELETDQFGNESEVKRARFPHQHDEKLIFDTPDTRAAGELSEANSVIENKKSVENRDRNSDIATNRYPYSHPESRRDRGNFDVNEA